MGSTEEASWSILPEEIRERVLSFLPVPALCKCRCVCREWNQLVRRQSFLDLCDLHGSGHTHYLFLTRYLCYRYPRQDVDGACWRTTYFLDLDNRRWYAIPIDTSPFDASGRTLRHLAVDDGLVCELSSLNWISAMGELEILDPVAKTRRKLPLSTSDGEPVWHQSGDVVDFDDVPKIVTVVDTADRSFKVFLFNRFLLGFGHQDATFFVYESCTDVWRRLATPPILIGFEGYGRELHEDSFVFFQGDFYGVFVVLGTTDAFLLSYNLERNVWRQVLAFGFEVKKIFKLIVSGNRIFMGIWSFPPVYVNSMDIFFEIREIFVNENSSTPVVKFNKEELDSIHAEVGSSRFQQNSSELILDSSSLLLVSSPTERLYTYDLRSGAVSALPQHPVLSAQNDVHVENSQLSPCYYAKLSELSLRNIL